MSIPASYQTVLGGFFSSDTPAQLDTLWQQFLAQYGYAAPPANNDPTAMSQLVGFSQGQTAAINSSLTLSPTEQVQRSIIFDAFNSAIAMMNTLQGTAALQAAILQFYSNYQQEYTTMMAKTPIYAANSSDDVALSASPLDITYGYDAMSPQDYITYSFVNKAKVIAGGFTYDYGTYASLQAAEQAFVTTDYPANKAAIDSAPTINWRFNDTDTASNQQRSETNSLNQQFIANIQAYRQVIRDQAQQIQNYLSQIKDAIQQESNILSSIIQSLQAIIQAITTR